MYESPIEIITKEMSLHFDDNIYRAVQEYGIEVDKDELIKALRYDRDQYDKGYRDGINKFTEKLMELYVDELITDDMHCSVEVIKANINDIKRMMIGGRDD